jgi:hypothetical protein
VSNPPYSKERIAQCAEVLKSGERIGLIKERPTSVRINVEDRIWSETSAGSKRGFLLALGCAAYGRPLGDDHVVAYGFRSGKRLALATGHGVDLY